MPFEAGKIQTYVGTGEAGYAGDGGPALQALCTEPVSYTHLTLPTILLV